MTYDKYFLLKIIQKGYRVTYNKPIHDHLYHTKPTHWYSGVDVKIEVLARAITHYIATLYTSSSLEENQLTFGIDALQNCTNFLFSSESNDVLPF